MFKSKYLSRYFVCTVLAAALFSCSDIDAEQTPIVDLSAKVDSVIQKSTEARSNLDSALYYFQKQMDYKLKRDEAEIKYLRTEEDRYRVEGNRYVDSSRKYSKLLQSLAARK